MNTNVTAIYDHPEIIFSSATECCDSLIRTSMQSLDLGFQVLEEMIWRITDKELMELHDKLLPLVARYMKEANQRGNQMLYKTD